MQGVKEFVYGRNAVYETLRAKRRELFGLQIADGAKTAGRITEIMELAADVLAASDIPGLRPPRSVRASSC